ncbi:MAG: nitronate monooxygenase, partial [Phenylobacterium sp.]
MALRDLLDNLAIPILQAPMVGASPPEMALAVSQAGGMGSIAAGAMAPDQIGPEIERLRTATDAPFGV